MRGLLKLCLSFGTVVGIAGATNESRVAGDGTINLVVVQIDLSPALSLGGDEGSLPSAELVNHTTRRHRIDGTALNYQISCNDGCSTLSTTSLRPSRVVSSILQSPTYSWMPLPAPISILSSSKPHVLGWHNLSSWNTTTKMAWVASGKPTGGGNLTIVNGTNFPSGGSFFFPTATSLAEESSSNSPKRHRLLHAIARLSQLVNSAGTHIARFVRPSGPAIFVVG